MKKKKTEVTVTSRIPIELKEKIDAYCEQTHVTVMGLIELAVEEYIIKHTDNN